MIDLTNDDSSELGIRCRELDITATADPGMIEELPTFDVSGMHSYRVHLRYHFPGDSRRSKFASVDFYQGSAHTKPPTVADVLYCILSDASARHHGNFEDWAAECGFDEDSRKAERIYERCIETARSMVDCFGEDMLCQLEQLEH